MRLWLNKHEYIAASGFSARHIERLVSANEIESRLTDKTSLNGRRHREYSAASLPPAALAKLTEQKIETSSSLVVMQPKGTDVTSKSPLHARVLVTDKHKRQAASRLRILEPVISFRRERNSAQSNALTLEEVVANCAAQSGKSERTLWRWLKQFDKLEVAGLADKTRNDKGKSRFFSTHPAADKFIQAKYLSEVNLTVQLAYDALVREWHAAHLALNDDDEPPTYETVRQYLNHLPGILRGIARGGTKSYNSNFEAYIQRDFNIDVNEIWVADHRVFDVFVYNDFFPNIKKFEAVRIWITKIIDMRSRFAVGWSFSINPSSDSIASALHMAISNYGLPRTFYVDNGKDFKKIGAKKLDYPVLNGLLPKLGVDLQYCIPEHPQSKLIESMFSGMSKRFDLLFGKAYAGRKTYLRPEECEIVRMQHKMWLDRKRRDTPLTPLSDFIAMYEQWISEYNKKPHHGRGMSGKSPADVFLISGIERRIPDMLEMASLFWRHQKCQVLRGGCVQLFKQRYMPIDPSTAAQLTLRIGEDIAIAFDPANIGNAIALDPDGNAIGGLQAEVFLAHGPISKEFVGEHLRMRRNIHRAIKDYVAAISIGVPTEEQYLRERSDLPPFANQPRLLPQAVGAPPQFSAAARASAANASSPHVEDVATELLGLMEND